MAEGTGDRSYAGRIASGVAVYELFLLAAALWFLGKFVRYAFPPLFETFQGTYQVSTTEIGLAYAGFLTLYALLQFPSGALADRFGSARVITAGAVVAGAGALVLVVEPPFAVLVGAMVVLGAGTGAHKTVSIRLLSNVYPAHLGRALGVFDTIGAMGGVVAPLIVAAILGLHLGGWPGLFGATGLVFVALGGVFLVRTARDGRVTADASGTETVLPWRSYLATFSRPPVAAFAVLTILVAFAYNGFVAFLPLLLSVEGGVSPALASVLYSILFAASAVQIASGEAADRFGPLSTLTVCLVGATLGMTGLLVLVGSGGGLASTPALAAVAGVILLIGLGAHGYRPARDVHVVALVPDATTGGTLGVIRTMLMLAAAVSPLVVGIIGDLVGLYAAFILLTVSAALAAGLAGVLVVLSPAVAADH